MNYDSLIKEILRCLVEGNLQRSREILSSIKDSFLLNDDITEEEIKIKLDTIRDDLGRPLLHVAVEHGSIEIIQEMLSIDFDLQVVDSDNKTAAIIAEEKGFHDIASLLKIKQDWQKRIWFNFNKTAHLINNAIGEMQLASGSNKIFIIGPTGAGKSTLLNYLNGTQYEVIVYRGRLIARRIGGSEEIATVGSEIYKSETLYPKIVKKANLDFVYCDLAGLFDSRKIEEQICGTVSSTILSKLKGGVNGILVVLDQPGFMSEKGESFKKTAKALTLITKNNPELIDSIYFVITKMSPEVLHGSELIKPEMIITNFIDPLLKSLADTFLDEEEIELKNMLQLIKTHNILIPNISDEGISGTIIEELLAKLQPKDANLFNFVNYDNSQRFFYNELLKIVQGFIERKTLIENTIPAKIKELQDFQKYIPLKIQEWNDAIRWINIEKCLQEKLDRIVTIWVEVEKENQSVSKQEEITKLINESKNLFVELYTCETTKLPRMIEWLSVISCTPKVERKSLLKQEMSNRRWCLPWSQDSSYYMAGGPTVLLQKEITKHLEWIADATQKYKEYLEKQQQLHRYLLEIKMEIQVMKDLFEITYKIIDILKLYDLDYLRFQKEYNEYNGKTAKEFNYLFPETFDIESLAASNEEKNKLPAKEERQSLFFQPDLKKESRTEHSLLQEYGFIRKQIIGDGNCLFRAIAIQLNMEEEQHQEIRHIAVEYMRTHIDDFAGFISDFNESTFNERLNAMSQNGVWGDIYEIYALAQYFHRPIAIIHNDLNRNHIVFNQDAAGTPIILYYTAGLHYDAIISNNTEDQLFGYRKILQDQQNFNVDKAQNIHDKNKLKISVWGHAPITEEEQDIALQQAIFISCLELSSTLQQGMSPQLLPQFLRLSLEDQEQQRIANNAVDSHIPLEVPHSQGTCRL